MNYTPRCVWHICSIKKKNHHMWRITRWMDVHKCFGSCVGNNNKNLNSTTIGLYNLHSVARIHILKNSLNVDVFYDKHDMIGESRRKAYIVYMELGRVTLMSFPIVKWFHCLNSSSHVTTFKYVFWAFGDAINVFHLWRPTILVDGFHSRIFLEEK
uniref:Uncharacterized protein n=1 Tax=Lactuca sativa TaxID=4236 RepID=A0A9R1WBC5_LACSA|nr:hypothetical protein LSAT_V11C200054190 [Lactuca sativa]